MTLSATNRRAGPFSGNGVTTVFPFTYRVFANSDLLVKRTTAGITTTLVLNTDYSVTLNPDQNAAPGGSITLTMALAVGSTLNATGNLPYDQPLDLPSGGNFNPGAQENEFDRIVMQIQQLKDSVDTLPVDATLSTRLGDASSSLNGAGMVAYNSALTYAIGSVGSAIAAAVAGNGVRMIAAGADGTGVVDCTAIFNSVLAALPVNGMIIFDAGKTFKLNNALCDGKAFTIFAVGAIITGSSASGILRKTDHGNKLTVIGGIWSATSTANAINYAATASATTYLDLVAHNAKFLSQSAYAVRLVGCRETVWSQCEFTSTATGGVYANQANNPYFSQCIFIGQGAGTAFFADGQGSPNSGNPILRDCELMGWDIGVKIVGCDDFKMDGCTVDYNITYNTYISSQDSGSIRGCYLGSNNNVAALVLTSEGNQGWAPDRCEKISISDCNFTGHIATGFLYDNMLLTGDVSARYPVEIAIRGNHFQFYTRYGINLSTTDRVSIFDNDFDPRNTFGRVAISNATGTGDSTSVVAFNRFPSGTDLSPAAAWGANLSFSNVFNNIGYLGQNTSSANGGANSINMQTNGNTGIGGPGSSYWHWVNATGPVRLDRFSNTPTFRSRRSGGNITAPATVGAADPVGNFSFDAGFWNGAATVYSGVASIQAQANGTQDATHSPGLLDFFITPSYGAAGAITPVLRLAEDRVSINYSTNLNTSRPALLFHGDSLTTTTGIFSGPGAPTATAAKGSLYLRTDGGAGTTLYVNEAGTNVWVAK